MHNVIKCPIELWQLIPQYAYCYISCHNSQQEGYFREWTQSEMILSSHKYKTDRGYTEFSIETENIVDIHKEPAENAQIEILLLVNSIKNINDRLERISRT